MTAYQILLTVALLTVFGTCAYPQEPSRAAPATSYDVATVKPSQATDGHHHMYSHPGSVEFTAVNMTLKGLIAFAYNIPETRIVGGPKWLGSDGFDIDAKVDSALQEQLRGLSSETLKADKQHRLQHLLAERFNVAVHRETRELPTYDLVAAKGGPKLAASRANGTTISSGRSKITVLGDDSVGLLAEQLAQALGRVVVNRTGLQGRYEITLTWAPEDAADSGPSLFTAIEEQLGLKLEAGKGPVEVLVLDRAEQPTAN